MFLFEIFDEPEDIQPLTDEQKLAALERKIEIYRYQWHHADDVYDDLENILQSTYGDPKKGYIAVDDLYIAKDTPQNRKLIPQRNIFKRKARKLHKMIQDLEAEKKEIIKRFAKTKIKDIQTNVPKSPKLALSQIPDKIILVNGTNKTSMENPYFYGTNNRYAGHPAHNPVWSSSPMQTMYIHLSRILKQYNVPELTMMYSSTYYNRGGNITNFVVVNANNTFAWRKYDRGGGSGQNNVYIVPPPPHGKLKFQTSWIISADPAKLHKWLDPIAIKKP